MMTLQRGESTGEAHNEHPRAEQWILVLRGVGQATVGGRRVGLRRHSLLLIAKGEIHKITNSGSRPLSILNIYAPPAYTVDGNVRKTAKRNGS